MANGVYGTVLRCDITHLLTHSLIHPVARSLDVSTFPRIYFLLLSFPHRSNSFVFHVYCRTRSYSNRREAIGIAHTRAHLVHALVHATLSAVPLHST